MPPLPNKGQIPGLDGPPSVDHLFKDNDGLADVFLTVVPAQTRVVKDNHWMIRWYVATGADGWVRSRIIHLVQHRDNDGVEVNHLTNWGPITASTGSTTLNSPSFLIKNMTLTERRALEQIARDEEVMAPDGQWNCQDWTESVLQKAVDAGLINAQKLAALKASAARVSIRV